MISKITLPLRLKPLAVFFCLAIALVLSGCGSGGSTMVAPQDVQVTVQNGGSGAGTITSSPAGINCGTACTASFPSGTTVTLSATAGTGSTFAGWTGACSGMSSCTVSPTSAASVTATFNTAAVPTNQLSVQANGTGTGTVTSSPAGINCGTACASAFPTGTTVTLTAAAGANSTFAGWSGACSAATGPCTVDLTADSTVTATFNTTVVPTVQLSVASAGTGAGTITSNPAGINCGSTCSASFASGTAVTLTATPSTGSTFTGWSGASCGSTATCTVTLSSAATVTATFSPAAPPTATLTVTDSGSGTITSSPAGISCPSTCTYSFPVGTAVTLSEAVSGGSTFGGWSGGGCTGTGASCTVNLTANTTVNASFNAAVQPLQLTVNFANTGTGTGTVLIALSGASSVSCATNCSNNFSSGSQVTLTPAAATSSTFTGWSGNGPCTGTSACTFTLSAATTVTAVFDSSAQYAQVVVTPAGTGTGTVTSSSPGIACSPTCTASFPVATSHSTPTTVTLTATPAAGTTFAGWSGTYCTGVGTCTLTLSANGVYPVTPTFEVGTAGITSINHIIVFAQENRSLDSFYGALRQYWAANGIQDQSFDGLPQFNPTSGPPPLKGPAPTLPGCEDTWDPANPADCQMPASQSATPANPVTSFHMVSVCDENTSPSWNEAHVDWNYWDQLGRYPAKNNGFVYAAAHDARFNTDGSGNLAPFYDVYGKRAMGYYNGTDLNYAYFMASNFAISDRFFQPAMSRTNINREYLAAATSGGYAYPNGFNAADSNQLTSTTIFQELDNAGITWKIYINADSSSTTCPNQTQPALAACIFKYWGYLENFTYGNTVENSPNIQNLIGTMQDFESDLSNGTLPQVAMIEPASEQGLDEHGSDSDNYATNIQQGEKYTESLINDLMATAQPGSAYNYWADTALFFTYDESGGLYDHVSPQPAPSPDGIHPVDVPSSGAVCASFDYSTESSRQTTCDFTWTGYRIPMIVVSSFAKKNYVSHTVADSTAILKFIETRFGLPALNNRDAAQIDMTEFFDFNNPQWTTPPAAVPAQNVSNPCYLTQVP